MFVHTKILKKSYPRGYTALLVTLTIFFFLGRSLVNCVKPPLYTWDLEESDDGTSDPWFRIRERNHHT